MESTHKYATVGDTADGSEPLIAECRHIRVMAE